MIKIEVTRYGKYSNNIYEIIQKKLAKRYDNNTVVVVLVDRKEKIAVTDLYQFIKENNSENRRIYILGGTGDKTSIRILPCSEIKSISNDIEWMEAEVTVGSGKKTSRKYDGIAIKEPFMKRSYQAHPVYVKKVNLSR